MSIPRSAPEPEQYEVTSDLGKPAYRNVHHLHANRHTCYLRSSSSHEPEVERVVFCAPVSGGNRTPAANFWSISALSLVQQELLHMQHLRRKIFTRASKPWPWTHPGAGWATSSMKPPRFSHTCPWPRKAWRALPHPSPRSYSPSGHPR